MLDFHLNLFFLAPNHLKLMFKERKMQKIEAVQVLKREKRVERKEAALKREESLRSRKKKKKQGISLAIRAVTRPVTGILA